MKKYALIITFFICQFSLFANKKVNTKQILKNAYYYYDYNNFANALNYFNQYYQQDSTNSEVNYAIARSLYYSSPDKNDCKKYLQKSDKPEALFLLGQIEHFNENPQLAIDYYKKYLKTENRTIADSIITYYINKSLVANRFMATPNDVLIKNLGDSINSEYPDYVPIISSDEKTIYFTSRRKGGFNDDTDPIGNYFEDIYQSNYIDGQWQKAFNMGAPVNTATHESCLGISLDQNLMLIYRTNKETTGGEIYELIKKDSVWNEPKLIEAEFNNLNSNEKTICLVPSPDSITYYFVSNREGGFGGTDIYRIVRFDNNRWSQPINMGDKINTPYDEDSPTITSDGRTLFFSSKGHENMGDYDIFSSTLDNNGIWSNPQNLGYPINTVGDDRFFSISPDGRRGYYSKPKFPGSNDIDIFVTEIIQRNEIPQITLICQFDNNDSLIKNTNIVIREKNNDNVYGIYKPSTSNHRAIIILRPGIEYYMVIENKDCKTQTHDIFYPIDIRNNEIDLNFTLKNK